MPSMSPRGAAAARRLPRDEVRDRVAGTLRMVPPRTGRTQPTWPARASVWRKPSSPNRPKRGHDGAASGQLDTFTPEIRKAAPRNSSSRGDCTSRFGDTDGNVGVVEGPCRPEYGVEKPLHPSPSRSRPEQVSVPDDMITIRPTR